MGKALKIVGFLNKVYRKWLDELSRLIEWFLHADSDGIIFHSALYLWLLNDRGPLQLYLASVFDKKIPFVLKWPQERGFFC